MKIALTKELGADEIRGILPTVPLRVLCLRDFSQKT